MHITYPVVHMDELWDVCELLARNDLYPWDLPLQYEEDYLHCETLEDMWWAYFEGLRLTEEGKGIYIDGKNGLSVD